MHRIIESFQDILQRGILLGLFSIKENSDQPTHRSRLYLLIQRHGIGGLSNAHDCESPDTK